MNFNTSEIMAFKSTASNGYENFIIDAIQADKIDEPTMVPIMICQAPKTIITVATDAVKLDGIRINATYDLAIEIADTFGYSLPTEKISDIIFKYSEIKIRPAPRTISSSGIACVQHSRDVDAYIRAIDSTPDQLIADVGKDWIIHPGAKKNLACNFGWHIETNKNTWNGIKLHKTKEFENLKVIQPASFVHTRDHSDYSQTIRLVSRDVIIEDQYYDLFDIISDPQFYTIISYDRF
jgi:hypothetical protein